MVPAWLVDRGAAASFIVVAAALAVSARFVARLTGASPRRVEDAYWAAGVLFLVAGRIAFLATNSPALVTDLAVLIRFTDGLEPTAGALAALGWALWRSRGGADGDLWAACVAGLALATATYDLACPVRASCYGITASPPLGFLMHGLSEPRLPTPLIEGAALLIVLGAMTHLLERWTARRVAWALLAALVVTRLATLPISVQGAPLAEAVTLGAVALLAAGLAIRSTTDLAASPPAGSAC